MSRPVWRLVNILFRGIERLYRGVRGVEPVGTFIWLGKSTWHGEPKRFGDSELRPGEPVGIIHFNNEALQQAQAERSRPHAGFVFARLLLPEMQALADQIRDNPKWRDVAGFYGVTWIPPHGRVVGFVAQPLASGWRTKWLTWYFRALLYAFNPDTARAVGRSLRPHEFWLSRNELLAKFPAGTIDVERASIRRAVSRRQSSMSTYANGEQQSR